MSAKLPAYGATIEFVRSVYATIPKEQPPVAAALGGDASALHAFHGLLSEIAELLRLGLNPKTYSKDDAIEEIGDTAWYTVYAAYAADPHTPDLTFFRMLEEAARKADSMAEDEYLREWAAMLDSVLDGVKRGLYYGKWLEPQDAAAGQRKLAEDVTELGATTLLAVCDKLDVDLEAAFEHNARKLALRYPSGYSHEAAARRADKEPRQ